MNPRGGPIATTLLVRLAHPSTVHELPAITFPDGRVSEQTGSSPVTVLERLTLAPGRDGDRRPELASGATQVVYSSITDDALVSYDAARRGRARSFRGSPGHHAHDEPMRTETLPTEARLDAARDIARSRLRLSAPALLAAGSLAGLTVGSFVIVLMAAERPSTFTPTSAGGYFPAWMTGPLRGLLPGLTHNDDRLAWLLSGVMLAMYVLYVVAFRFADRVRAGWTIAALLAIHLAFLLSPPLQYTDVFNYIHYGRMGALDGLNPYTVIPALAPHADASFALSNWHHLLSPYGPAFTLFSYALVPLGVAGSFWAIKLAVALASLGTLALVWRCAQLLGRSPVSAVAFVGLNPIVLVWGLGADHNDSLMLFFVVLAVYLTLRTPAAPRAAGAALVLAVFIKASAAVLLPVFIATGHRRGLVRGGLAAVAVLGTASVIAFGAHTPDLSTQSRLVTAIGLPNLLGLVLGQGEETHALHLVLTLGVVAVVGGSRLPSRGTG